MARQNTIILRGAVMKLPMIGTNPDGTKYGFMRLVVARARRDTGDGNILLKCDNPLIMTRDEKQVDDMQKFEKFDIVDIKGTLSSKPIKKVSYCEHCGEKNIFYGALIYVHPIYMEKVTQLGSEEECLSYLNDHREISNQAYIIGTLCRAPGKVKSKYAYAITKYQLATGRKYHIRTDPPEIKVDWPWVKSYGENAESDFKYLQVGSEVMIDGFLQTRNVMRRSFCGQEVDEKGHPKKTADGVPVFRTNSAGVPVGCGEPYEWKDNVTELVAYATEYLNNYLEEPSSREENVAEEE